MLSLGLAAVIDLCKKVMKVGGRRRSRNIIKADSRSAPMCRHIPEEILIEILVRLPADSLMRFKCVSKHWSSLISSRYFTNLFFTFSSSSTRRRVFMTREKKCHQIHHRDIMMFSSSLSNLDTTPNFLQLNHHLTLSGIYNKVHFVSVLRGLMCLRVERAIRVINVTTRQVLNLPLVKSNMVMLDSFFGYDSANDEYKVLITNWSLDSKEWRYRSETQVLVLGTGASWRNTRSHTSPPPPHCPCTNGISINNVLYYGALTHGGILVLMSFDLNSEEFNQIELPIEARTLPCWRYSQLNLINYQGRVTLVDDFRLNACRLDLWVVEDPGKNKVSHKVFFLPCHQLKVSLESEELVTRGTSRGGEVMLFGRIRYRYKNTTLAIYNLETNRITRELVIESVYSKFSNYVDSMLSMNVDTTLWDDVENIMYLEA